MIALLASVFLGLYIFLPAFLFEKLAYNFRVVTKTGKGRFEEVISGASVSLLPFAASYFASRWIWFVGHWPYPVNEDAAHKYADYKQLISALWSDSSFQKNVDATWLAIGHIRLDQFRFIFWMYCALGIEIVIVVLLTYYYGSLSKYPLYRLTFGRIFLGRASHWEVLLTGFAFSRRSRPQVAVDALTADNHLYAGNVADFFLKPDGELSGLLLKDIRRFKRSKLEEDRKAGLDPDAEDYWTEIPGANFYLPVEKVASLNIRYGFPEKGLLFDVQEFMNSLNLGDSVKVSLEAISESSASEREKPIGERGESE